MTERLQIAAMLLAQGQGKISPERAMAQADLLVDLDRQTAETELPTDRAKNDNKAVKGDPLPIAWLGIDSDGDAYVYNIKPIYDIHNNVFVCTDPNGNNVHVHIFDSRINADKLYELFAVEVERITHNF